MAIYTDNIEYAPFNSINRDRAINADHLARWLSSVNSDGVARKFDEFETTIANGLNVNVNSGVGFVDGHHIYLKASQTISIDAANSAGDRIDTIGFRLEKTERRVVIYYKAGEVGSGEAPTPLDDDDYIEIPLYNINVARSATTLTAADLIDVRTYVVSSATFFKRYIQSISPTLSTTRKMTITVPFNSETDDIEIYINGIALLKNQYEISGNEITFWRDILAGNEIQVNVWHFVDGSTSMDSLNKVMTELEKVEGVVKYYYQCTGANDNKKISDIAQHFLAGTDEFAGINAYAQMEIVVCGDCAVTEYYSGDGSQARPFTYFAVGRAAESSRTIYFDFANCSRISIACQTGTGIYSTIFSGTDVNIRNCKLNVTQGYNVDIFNGTKVHCQDSEFWMTTTNDCCVGRCCGYFDRVRTSITSVSGNAYGFYGNGNLTRVIGGDHYAWTGNSSKEAVCFYVQAGQTENVLFVQMANMPSYVRSGYTQTRPFKINNGYATIISNAMWMAATQANGSFYNTTNCIAYGNVILSKN